VKLPLYSQTGEPRGTIDVDDRVFGTVPNRGLLHQAVVRQLANARTGTAMARTRAEVAGTTKKMYRQKGTGRARHGSQKVGSWRGGGVIHGPRPRSYEQGMPRKMRLGAVRSALSAKAAGEGIIVLEELAFERPQTSAMVTLLGRLPVSGRLLLSLESANPSVVLSARNIPLVHTAPARALNAYTLLNHDYLIATVGAIRTVERWLGTGFAATEEQGSDETAAPAIETESDAPTDAPAPRRRRSARSDA